MTASLANAGAASGFDDQGLIYVPARLGLSINSSSANLEAEVDNAIVLKAKILRLTLDLDWLFTGSEEFNAPHMALLKSVLERLHRAHLPVLFTVGDYPTWMTQSSSSNTLPCRSAAASENSGSAYFEFLTRYNTSLEALAENLPDVQGWEPGNELNLKPHAGAACDPSLITTDTDGTIQFTANEKLGIMLDLMFEAHSAIHSSNHEAIVFTPPIASDADGENIRQFFSDLYSQIHGHERDYFDAISWHPNLNNGDSGFTTAIQQTFAVIEQAGDGNLPIVFSDIIGLNHAASFESLSELAQESFTWLNYLIVPINMDPATSDAFCALTHCLTPASNGPFKALVLGTKAWQPFYLKGSSYCEYVTPETINAAPSLRSEDVSGKHFQGVCQ